MLPGELADARKRDEGYTFEVTYFESIPPEYADAYWAERGGRPINTAILPQEPEWRPSDGF